MAISFFELVNDKFFNPFTGENKEINFEILSLINRKMDDEMRQFPREDVLSWIEDYLISTSTKLIDDETGVDEGNDYKTTAANKIRYFVTCGWLIDENDNRTLKTTYQMDSNAIVILNAMEEVVRSDTRPIEYTGYVRNVYTLLKTFQTDKATEYVEQIHKNTKELVDGLRGLNVKIKNYLKKLMSDKTLTPREILDQLLVEYQDKVILKVFNNLRMKDNPNRYKGTIIEKIASLLEENNLQDLINEYIQTKKNGIMTTESVQEAREFFESSLGYVEMQFRYIEDNLNLLDKRNAKYAATAQSRLMFLMNESEDIEGKIIELLKNIAEADDIMADDSPFDLFDFGKIDEQSLYTPRTARRKAISTVEKEEEPIDEEELRKAHERLLNEAKFNCSNINKFILEQLINSNKIEAKDMVIKSFDDIIKLFLAGLYSGNEIMEYKITYTGSTFKWRDKILTNFIVERK